MSAIESLRRRHLLAFERAVTGVDVERHEIGRDDPRIGHAAFAMQQATLDIAEITRERKSDVVVRANDAIRGDYLSKQGMYLCRRESYPQWPVIEPDGLKLL